MAPETGSPNDVQLLKPAFLIRSLRSMSPAGPSGDSALPSSVESNDQLRVRGPKQQVDGGSLYLSS